MNVRKCISLSAVGLLLGCGGSNATFRGDTPFVGFYQGNWLEPASSATGTEIVTVDGNAVMQGTVNDLEAGQSGALWAHTDPAGGLRGNITYTAPARVLPFFGSMALRAAGTFGEGDPGGIGGTLTVTDGAGVRTIQFNTNRG